ncbi:MAG: phosphoribosylglycinamide formyltransferase [Candidatus Eisenbacteria bacterium]
MPPVRSARLAVFASGNGSNFEALAVASRAGSLGGTITALLCDQPQAFVLERARQHGIEALTPPCGRFQSRLEDEQPWLEALRERGIECVLLAGFMRRLHAPLLTAYQGRMLNIHPSLLPSFPGLDAIGQAWRHGVRWTGCTVHLVEDALDAGPIVAQSGIEVGEGESLEALTARLHHTEHELYPVAVRRFLTQPWRIEGRRLLFEGAGTKHD